MRFLPLFLAFATFAARADIVDCHCDVTRPETLTARQCSLCVEAEKQPPDVRVFILKDVNPTKPGRWIVLPRAHDREFAQLPPDLRTELLRTAIEKAKSLFGDAWGVAYNAPALQTQCHVHLHIGKWMPAVENSKFITVERIEDIPAPPKGVGFWIHPVGKTLHVHIGDEIAETVLVR